MLRACVAAMLLVLAAARGQAQQTRVASPAGNAVVPDMWSWTGVPVVEMKFSGVEFSPGDPMIAALPQAVGAPLDPQKVRDSLRQLYASGLYRNLDLEGSRGVDGVHLNFVGVPRFFIGTVIVEGVKDDHLASVLAHASRLEPGTAFSEPKMADALQGIKLALDQNGYHRGTVTASTIPVPNSLRNIIFHVAPGQQARIGTVQLSGDAGMTVEELRHRARLPVKDHFYYKVRADHDTITRALTRLRTYYQNHSHLEAVITLQSEDFRAATNTEDLSFNANQGPTVNVMTEGLHISAGRLHRIIPIYEEGAVDDDLLNEGARNLRDAMQRDGYFDAKVSVHTTRPDAKHEQVIYDVDRGDKHKVGTIVFAGNHAFTSDALLGHMHVKPANVFLRQGLYSQQLLAADVTTIETLYRSAGYTDVSVTTSVDDVLEPTHLHTGIAATLRLHIAVNEGVQHHYGAVDLQGATGTHVSDLRAMLKTKPGLPFSLASLTADRDAVAAYYQKHGYSEVRVDLQQTTPDPAKNLIDVHFIISEGPQVFVDQILISGRKYSRPNTVIDALKIKPGYPLDQNALMNSQRNLYDTTLFNEVNIAIENPTGDAPKKNVLVQLTEARRWSFLYGVGFEAETGEPSRNCPSAASLIQLGINPATFICSPNGSTGASERVSLDITRNSLFGRAQSITLGGSYGSLEKRATMTYAVPHLFNARRIGFTLSGGYNYAQDITTFASSQLTGTARISQKFFRADTMIYDFEYRRVEVNANTLQISAALIPLFSQPELVGGPGITWIRDTRTPSPLDATKGSYTSVQEFFSSSKFGSEADFNRIDATNSTYYHFGRLNFVLARSTRLGLERTFGASNPTTIPLPERLYAGGGNSLRGFPINAAGPRDLQTGYPIGGTGVFVNSTELRLPAQAVPLFSQDISLVLFHDMGNVFANGEQIWTSIGNFRQPNVSTCTVVTGVTEGTCNFNFFSHDIGTGVRYKTPIGPLRLDFSYNLNPPLYPVILDYNNNPPNVGRAGHFNFFFSIGQSF